MDDVLDPQIDQIPEQPEDTVDYELVTYFTSPEGFEQTLHVTATGRSSFEETRRALMQELVENGYKPRIFSNKTGNGGGYSAPPQQAPTPISAAPSAAPSGGPVPPCERCGQAITGFTMQGKWYSPEGLVESRRKNYGQALCGRCAKDAKAARG